ncbi:DUF4190 domain-containing protein [Brevibacterium moorei]|uniref:DUF4190 domain-containing protein n=1 Tax=Brevibacterium moorei TaxID=2968457 RepID=UPI00211C9F89|nr:DUF4190 domain-containing protein [Brevibacterium sp. 68QC2CO]MCQ9385691.1 DUF4190 domain-containing protein [Brevibacterium sp. 68QC2CO]
MNDQSPASWDPQQPQQDPYQQGYQPVPVPNKTNSLAIAAIICVWFVSLVGLILGYIALNQIKRTGEGGRGMALAAVIIGWIALALGTIVAIIQVIALGSAMSGY